MVQEFDLMHRHQENLFQPDEYQVRCTRYKTTKCFNIIFFVGWIERGYFDPHSLVSNFSHDANLTVKLTCLSSLLYIT